MEVPENDDSIEIECSRAVDVGVQTDSTIETVQERDDRLQRTIKALEQQVYRQTKTIDLLNDSVRSLREEIQKPKISLDQFEGMTMVQRFVHGRFFMTVHKMFPLTLCILYHVYLCT